MLLMDKHIFIVEDNTMNRTIYKIMMIQQGAIVKFDRWGRDTLGLLHDFQADLIILDLMLPSGDSGYTIYDTIRAVPEYDAIPIVAVSAAEPAIAIPKVKQQGFSGFIAKPIDDVLFPRQLAQILAGDHIWYAGERYGGLVK